ncbi:MFS transporter [Rhodomicrobium sp. Az07]|uniref:MFS transporter n=1 Tax=Rhodomicrobium sp. Az07 TaxID=2839034 RepID=UPI001BEA9BE7|nr:MFS transporter [Rhodomicrobium sp. Az07]MBT3069711.1 MFS transporter [Rhodomicrobium sp. Az07]
MKALARAQAARLGCAFFFLVNGLAYGSVVARMPALKMQTGVNDAQIGQAILCLGIGGLCAFPIAGVLQSRIGSKYLVGAGTALMMATWPLIGLAAEWWQLAAAFFAFGYACGTLEVGGGVQAVMVERALGRPAMSGFFALFSTGCLAGALVSAAASDIAPAAQYAAFAAFFLALLPFALRPLLPDAETESAEKGGLRLPPLPILGLALLCLCAFLSEGAISDWGALLMKAAHGSTDTIAALAFAAFSATMIVGRLAGDGLRARYAMPALVRALAVVATVGMAVATLAPHPALAIAGFALAGLGLSVIAPALFSAAGNHPGVDPGIAVASISTLGYGGLLLGPSVIGFLAHGFGMSAAMMLIVGMCAAIALFAGRLKPMERSPRGAHPAE